MNLFILQLGSQIGKIGNIFLVRNRTSKNLPPPPPPSRRGVKQVFMMILLSKLGKKCNEGPKGLGPYSRDRKYFFISFNYWRGLVVVLESIEGFVPKETYAINKDWWSQIGRVQYFFSKFPNKKIKSSLTSYKMQVLY